MLWTILIGLLIGIGTMLVMPERDRIGAFVAIVVGETGSIVPPILGAAMGWCRPGEPAGIISSVLGAILLSTVYLALFFRDLQEAEPPVKQAGH